MSAKRVSIIREADDGIAKARISLGRPIEFDDFYITFRGEPEEVIKLLREALAVAERALPEGLYKDHR